MEHNGDSYDIGHPGTIEFTPTMVKVTVTDGSNTLTEEFVVRTVTYEDDAPDRLDYRTNGGDFMVTLNGDRIKNVSHYTGSATTMFSYKSE